jgi:hypothetical protein
MGRRCERGTSRREAGDATPTPTHTHTRVPPPTRAPHTCTTHAHLTHAPPRPCDAPAVAGGTTSGTRATPPGLGRTARASPSSHRTAARRARPRHLNATLTTHARPVPRQGAAAAAQEQQQDQAGRAQQVRVLGATVCWGVGAMEALTRAPHRGPTCWMGGRRGGGRREDSAPHWKQHEGRRCERGTSRREAGDATPTPTHTRARAAAHTRTAHLHHSRAPDTRATTPLRRLQRTRKTGRSSRSSCSRRGRCWVGDAHLHESSCIHARHPQASAPSTAHARVHTPVFINTLNGHNQTSRLRASVGGCLLAHTCTPRRGTACMGAGIAGSVQPMSWPAHGTAPEQRRV